MYAAAWPPRAWSGRKRRIDAILLFRRRKEVEGETADSLSIQTWGRVGVGDERQRSGSTAIIGGQSQRFHLELVATGEHFEMFLILSTAARVFQQKPGVVLYDAPRT